MKNTAYKLAESLSLALNPFVLLPIVYLIGLFATDFGDNAGQAQWLGALLIGNLILPLFWIYYLDIKGFVFDDTLKNKKLHRKRLIALLPIVVVLGLEIVTMAFFGVFQPLFAILVASMSIMILGGFISYYWKVSAHTIGLSTTITFLSLIVGPWILWSAVVIPFLGWARLKLHRHTPLQLIIGTMLPPITIIIIFNYFNLL